MPNCATDLQYNYLHIYNVYCQYKTTMHSRLRFHKLYKDRAMQIGVTCGIENCKYCDSIHELPRTITIGVHMLTWQTKNC